MGRTAEKEVVREKLFLDFLRNRQYGGVYEEPFFFSR